MSYLDELGLRAAERLETTLGAWVALASYERLADETRPRADPRLEARAIVGAIRCATALGDEPRAERFVDRWKAIPAHVDEPSYGDLLRVAARARAHALCLRLALAEAERRPTASSLYAAARALELANGFDAATYLRAARAADATPALRDRALGLVLEDACRRLDAHGLDPDERGELIELARTLDRTTAPSTARLAAGRVLALSLRPFERAQGLSLLCDVCRDADTPEAVREEALHHVAAHVDAWGSRLHPVELDRAAAVIGSLVEGPRRAALAERLAIARDAAGMAGPPSMRLLDRIRAAAPEIAAETYGDASPDPSARALAELEIALATGHVPRVAWYLVMMAVRSRSASIRDVGARALRPLLRRALAPPSYGYRALADEMIRIDADVGLSLYRLATRQREPGAAQRLVVALKWVAHRALDAGNEARALALLREAKHASAA